MFSLIALLGRRDSPTDGVQDYCGFLGRALPRHGVTFTIARVDWVKKGWLAALWELWHSSESWRGSWVILQYTALAWSRRGFPLGAIAVLAMLRCRGVRCGVMFHETRYNGGARWRDWIRGACQSWVTRRLYGLAAKAILADSLDSIEWLPKADSKATFIPIGASIPERVSLTANARGNGALKSVAIFCVTGPPQASIEIEEIAQAARFSASSTSSLRFVFLGRGTAEANDLITSAFRHIPVELSVLGLLDADEVSNVLANSDVMLCVRGGDFPTPRERYSGDFVRSADCMLRRSGNNFPHNRSGTRTGALSRPGCAGQSGQPRPVRRSLKRRTENKKRARSHRIFFLGKDRRAICCGAV